MSIGPRFGERWKRQKRRSNFVLIRWKLRFAYAVQIITNFWPFIQDPRNSYRGHSPIIPAPLSIVSAPRGINLQNAVKIAEIDRGNREERNGGDRRNFPRSKRVPPSGNAGEGKKVHSESEISLES